MKYLIKKILLPCFVSIILLILLLLALDFTMFHVDLYNFNKKLPQKYYFKYSLIIKPYSVSYIANVITRPIFNKNFKRNSIIVFGGSFAYGEKLKDNQTFSYKLSKATNRPVITKAMRGSGPQQTLIQAMYSTPDNLGRKTEYAIYVLIPDHVRRMNVDFFWPFFEDSYPRFELLKDSSLKLTSGPKWFERFYIIKRWKEKKVYSRIMDEKMVAFERRKFELHLIQTKKYLMLKYPDMKFIIIIYPQDMMFNNLYFNNNNFISDMEKEGFIIYIPPEMLTQKKYRFPDKHPNEAAWDLVVPDLVKKLKLN